MLASSRRAAMATTTSSMARTPKAASTPRLARSAAGRSAWRIRWSVRPSAEVDGANFEAAGPTWELDHDLVADALPDERPSERRRNRNRAAVDVGFVGSDDAEGLLLVGVEVRERNRGAEAHAIAAQLARIDDFGSRELVLDVLDARLDQTLPLLRGMVLRVLAEIAVLAGNADLSGDLGSLFLEPHQLVAELLGAGWRHGYLFGHGCLSGHLMCPRGFAPIGPRHAFFGPPLRRVLSLGARRAGACNPTLSPLAKARALIS